MIRLPIPTPDEERALPYSAHDTASREQRTETVRHEKNCGILGASRMSFGNGGFALRERWSALSNEQRISLIILSVFGVAALGLSFLFMSSHVRQPFLVPLVRLENARSFYEQQQADANELENLKKKDTDHDGLSDYAELYVYQTSPYLSDSDSDTVPDSIEVAMGTDPNCPRGKQCHEPLEENPATSTQKKAFTEFLNLGAPGMATTSVITSPAVSAGLQGFLANPPTPESMTPNQMRTYMIQIGLLSQKQNDLGQLSDDAIKKLYTEAYQEALNVQSAGQNPSKASSLPGLGADIPPLTNE